MRWTLENGYGLRFLDPAAPWYGKLWCIFRNRCPYCKCLDLFEHGMGEWTYLENGKRVRLGAIECRNCHKRWDWDTDDR